MHDTKLLSRRGMTLVELLMVIGIIVLLVAVAAPAIRPQLKDRKLREASRQLNTYIAAAKARAAQINRPVGFIIKRDNVPGRTQGSYEIYLAETPIPFAGDSIDSKATLTGVDGNGFAHSADFPDPQGIVKIGDTIQFDYKGPQYVITAASGTTVSFISPYNFPLPRAVTGAGQTTKVPFQVTRQPVVSSSPPLELPTGTVIDLQWSGLGKRGTELDAASDIKVMFTPTGAVERLYSGTSSKLADATIHMLVGRTDQLTLLQDDPNDLTKSNLLDPTVSWVSIGHSTGTVTTTENFVTSATVGAATASAKLEIARSLAVTKQTMGGR